MDGKAIGVALFKEVSFNWLEPPWQVYYQPRPQIYEQVLDSIV